MNKEKCKELNQIITSLEKNSVFQDTPKHLRKMMEKECKECLPKI